MATRTTKSPKTSTKPVVSPAQVLEDGPLVGHLADLAQSIGQPEPKRAAAKKPKVAAAPVVAAEKPKATRPKAKPAAAEVSPAPLGVMAVAPMDPQPEPPVTPTREELIRQAAHRRYIERGMTPGDPMRDWLDAEAEVDRASRPGG